MPRTIETDTSETVESDQDTSNQVKRGGARVRKVAPEGVATGLFEAPELDTPPPAATGFGNAKAADDARKVIELCKQHPGQWVKIGRFGNQTTPKGIWSESGIKFTHRSDPDVPGWFIRWAMYPQQGD